MAKKKYPDGGKTKKIPEVTIKSPYYYTENPNDPRIKAYQDSLALYNQGLKNVLSGRKAYPLASSEEQTALGKRDYNFLISGKAAKNNKRSFIDGYIDGLYKFETPSNTSKIPYDGFKQDVKDFTVKGNVPSSILYGAESYPIPLYKKPTQPVKVVDPNIIDILKNQEPIIEQPLIDEPWMKERLSDDLKDRYGIPLDKSRIKEYRFGKRWDNRLKTGNKYTSGSEFTIGASKPGGYVYEFTYDGNQTRMDKKDWENLQNEMKTTSKYSKGGKVDGPEKRNFQIESDSLTNYYYKKDTPWVKRWVDQDSRSISDPLVPGSGKTSTHLLSYDTNGSGRAKIYPTIVPNPETGELRYVGNESAREYADKNNTFMYADSALADYYTKIGMKKYSQLPQYDFGGWVKDNKQGILGGAMAVAGGALMATGIGAPIATPLISGGLGMVGNEFASDQAAAQQQDMMNQQVGLQGSTNPYAPTFRCGGKVKMPFGGTVTAPAELEKDEVFRTPDGKIAGLVDDQSIAHENGGAPMELPVGTEVLGKKKDKQSGKMFKELGQILAKKNKKLQELKDKTKNKYTLNSIRAMENKYQQKFSDLFRRQEESKGGKMAKGGMVKYSNGSTVEPPLEYEDWMSEAFVPHEYISPGMESYINNMNPGLAFQNNQMLNEIPPIAEGTPLTPEIKLSNPGVSFDNKVGGALGSQGLGTAMQFAPVAYNLIQSLRKPEKERLPEDYNRAVSTLSNRRYNIEPMLEANRTAQQIYDQNLKQAGAGAGQLASGRLASLGSRMRADMGAWAQKNNTEQGLWAPQTAQALMNRGQAQRGVDVANLQNEAARRNFGASATEGLAQGFATQQLMRNMKDRDYMAIQTYAKWLPMLANQFGDLDYVKQALNRG